MNRYSKYGNAKSNLEEKSLEWIQECYAEIHANVGEDWDPQLDITTYDSFLAAIKRNEDCVESLARRVWRFMESHRTCDNGGHNVHCCPFGCHTVSTE